MQAQVNVNADYVDPRTLPDDLVMRLAAHVHSQRENNALEMPATNAADKRYLEGKVFGVGWAGSPTHEDALNLFRALEVYPCPRNSRCEVHDYDQQTDLLLSRKIDAYFLSADCPDAKVQFAQDQLGDDFHLVAVPQSIVRRMRTISDRPYVPTQIDPAECSYSRKQGKIFAVGVARSVVAAARIDPQVAADVARALIETPPFSPAYFAVTNLTNSEMFPLHEAAKATYQKWIK